MINIISFALIFIFSGFVTYTPDWDSYEYFMYEGIDTSDYFFVVINNLVLKSGYDFIVVHKIHIIISATFLLLFINRFNKNSFIVILIYLPLVYLFYTTQIRYFAGYYVGLLALYYLLVKNNKMLFLLLFVFAFLNHSTLILLLGIIPLYKIDNFKFIKFVQVLSIFILIAVLLLSYLKIDFFQADKLVAYTQEEATSSILGGIYNFLPYFVISIITFYYFKMKASLKPDLLNDKKVVFLFKASIYPMIFFISALYFQVLGHRFIYPSLLLNILLFYYVESKYKSSINYYVIFYSVVILLYLYTFLLPVFVLNIDPFEDVRLMLQSNKLIQYFL